MGGYAIDDAGRLNELTDKLVKLSRRIIEGINRDIGNY
jgi:hypothetical protein